jgi:hypothetical protein
MTGSSFAPWREFLRHLEFDIHDAATLRHSAVFAQRIGVARRLSKGYRVMSRALSTAVQRARDGSPSESECVVK